MAFQLVDKDTKTEYGRPLAIAVLVWKGFPDETPCVHFCFCLFKIAILFRKLCHCIM